MFSERTNWQRSPNALSLLSDRLRGSGRQILDLTSSNPTELGFPYPAEQIASALSSHSSLRYRPEARGLLSARETVVRTYAEQQTPIGTDDVFLTASTSEAYTLIMKLLCNPGEELLVPKPSYPLFEFIARICDVSLRPYRLLYDGSWHIDFASLQEAVSPATRGIIVVQPHNPTGHYLSADEHAILDRIAADRNLPVICDEVFIDYSFPGAQAPASTAGREATLTFTLNGLSKLAALPQMKLGWIVLSGPRGARQEAAERLEILCDTYLSVNTPVQLALAGLLEAGGVVRQAIREQTAGNYGQMAGRFSGDSPCTALACSAGWYGMLRLPNIRNDEEWAVQILEQAAVAVFPGYFFEAGHDQLIVVSLLPPPGQFAEAVGRIDDLVRRSLS